MSVNEAGAGTPEPERGRLETAAMVVLAVSFALPVVGYAIGAGGRAVACTSIPPPPSNSTRSLSHVLGMGASFDPRPSAEPTDRPALGGAHDAEQWSDRDYNATWAGGLSRALAVLPEQALYEDLRRLQRDNRRIEWLDDLEQALDGHLDERAADGLRRLIELIDGERDETRAGGKHEAPGHDAPAGELLRGAIERISGLARKSLVDVDVISPLLLEGRDDVESVGDLLAGEMLGDFGGFLQADLRRSDFALGYASVLAWAPEGLAACGLPAGRRRRRGGRPRKTPRRRSGRRCGAVRRAAATCPGARASGSPTSSCAASGHCCAAEPSRPPPSGAPPRAH